MKNSTSNTSPAVAPTAPASLPATVAVVGLGLLGGSLGLALKRLPTPPRILGWARRQDAVDDGIARGCIDAGSTRPEDVLPAADLTILCLPVARIIGFACDCAGLWRRGAVVTDVGSTKRQIVAQVTPALQAHGVFFVGSHPMAGSEKSGLAHATADLYRNATVFVTPTATADAEACAAVIALWTAVGGRICCLDPDRHDALVARTSHVLHVLSACTVQTALRDPDAVRGTAGAFRDVSRIAASSPDMWQEILSTNQDELLAALDELGAELAGVRQAVAAGDWPAVGRYLAQAKALRDAWQTTWSRPREETP